MAGTKEHRKESKGIHTWRLRVWDGTRQVSQTFRAAGTKRASAAAADEELARMARRVNRGLGSTYGLTLSDLWDAYREHVSDRLSPTTWADTRRTMDNLIVPKLGTTKLSDLTSQQLDAFYAEQRQRVAPRTVLKYHRLLAVMLRQAERWGWIEVSPARNATTPQVRHSEISAPSLDVIRALLHHCQDDLTGLLILLAASLGARRGELVGLRWEDVDYATGVITIQRSVYETPGGGVATKSTKTDRPRSISLDPSSLDALRRLSAGRSGFVFSDDGETPWRPTRATREYHKVRKAVPEAATFRLHDLRHFHATQLLAAGFDATTVGKRLGHANPAVTLAVYSHALEARDRAAAATIGELLGG